MDEQQVQDEAKHEARQRHLKRELGVLWLYRTVTIPLLLLLLGWLWTMMQQISEMKIANKAAFAQLAKTEQVNEQLTKFMAEMSGYKRALVESASKPQSFNIRLIQGGAQYSAEDSWDDDGSEEDTTSAAPSIQQQSTTPSFVPQELDDKQLQRYIQSKTQGIK